MSPATPIPCSACGAEVLPPARYCDICGAPLGPPPAKPATPRP